LKTVQLFEMVCDNPMSDARATQGFECPNLWWNFREVSSRLCLVAAPATRGPAADRRPSLVHFEL
jgi:hypothetical protein